MKSFCCWPIRENETSALMPVLAAVARIAMADGSKAFATKPTPSKLVNEEFAYASRG
jgi:hypothetical protein